MSGLKFDSSSMRIGCPAEWSQKLRQQLANLTCHNGMMRGWINDRYAARRHQPRPASGPVQAAVLFNRIHRPVGWAALRLFGVDRRQAWLAVFVKPSYRRRGIGARLVATLLTSVRFADERTILELYYDRQAAQYFEPLLLMWCDSAVALQAVG